MITTTSEPRMLNRMDSVRDCTVDDALAWCHERGLDPTVVKITAAHFKWESPETDAERERRERYEAENLAREERWERETLARLTEKYGVSS